MDLFFEQLPVVLGALNTGFIQTLKLFFVTLLGAFPLGLLIALGSMSKFKPLSYPQHRPEESEQAVCSRVPEPSR